MKKFSSALGYIYSFILVFSFVQILNLIFK